MPNIVNVGYDSANYYVIESPTARLLVDVGWPRTLPKLQAALRRVGVPPGGSWQAGRLSTDYTDYTDKKADKKADKKDGRRQPGKAAPLAGIVYLLATHYHPDHAGAAQELKQLGVQLIVLETQVAGINFLNQWMKAKPQYHYVDITLHSNVNVVSAESRAFLRQLGLEGEIILTPGHSDDSVTLILDSGVAFTGDLPPPGMFQDLRHPAERSWELIRACHVHTVYPGHGLVAQLT
jgi:ribonuclease/clavin/mitogillin